MMELPAIFRTRTSRIAAVALLALIVDQVTKALVRHYLKRDLDEIVIIPGFFKLVHWENTGAAWSWFRGNNGVLAAVAFIALIVLFYHRHRFNTNALIGQIALGLIFAGIAGNLIDRIQLGSVVDFLFFHLQIGGEDRGFPAFNVADSAICIGVGLIFLITWKMEHAAKSAEAPAPK